MAKGVKKVFLVEDDQGLNELLILGMQQAGFETLSFFSGEEALNYLETGKLDFSVFLLDWNLPGISGLDLLKKIKQNPAFLHHPVIMHTANREARTAIEAFQNGADHFVAKPVSFPTLIQVLNQAYNRHCLLDSESEQSFVPPDIQDHGLLEFKSISEGKAAIRFLSSMAIESEKIYFALNELMINAVEHGNLEISYSEKTELLKTDDYWMVVEKRLQEEPYKQRRVRISFQVKEQELHLIMSDEGQGFDYKPYLVLDPERLYDCHGMGIALVKNRYLPNLKYIENGSKLQASFPIN